MRPMVELGFLSGGQGKVKFQVSLCFIGMHDVRLEGVILKLSIIKFNSRVGKHYHFIGLSIEVGFDLTGMCLGRLK